MKRIGVLLVALAGLTLAGCAGRYYDDRYRDGYYHGHPPAYGYDHDHYRDYRGHYGDRY